MRDRVLVHVRLAATAKQYEFRVPYDLNVGQVSDLMASILSQREKPLYEAPSAADLMYVDGSSPGVLLDPDTSIRELVLARELVDGQTLALV